MPTVYEPKSHRGGRRPILLLVEDDEDLRSALTDRFRESDFNVLAVGDGTTFADTVARTLLFEDPGASPDAIITDVRLPGFDGLGIVEGLRKAGWNVPVFVVSALPEGDLAARVERLGKAFLFPKPFDIEELEDAVRRAIGCLEDVQERERFFPHNRSPVG